MVRLLWLTLSHPHWMPGPGDIQRKCLCPGAAGPSHLGPPGPETRWLGMGAGKDYEALTCVAASYVSWSGLKPIWTFFGHWRKHLQNLKSERRSRERNGECAPHAEKPVRTPPSATSVSCAGLWSPPKPSRIPATIPIPMPRLTLSRSALETTDFEKFRCKRGQGRGALEGRGMGE